MSNFLSLFLIDDHSALGCTDFLNKMMVGDPAANFKSKTHLLKEIWFFLTIQAAISFKVG